MLSWSRCSGTSERFYERTIAIRVAEPSPTCAMNGGMVQALRPVDLKTADEISLAIADAHPYKPTSKF